MHETRTPSPGGWIRSSYSQHDANCVEIRGRAVRDAKNVSGPILNVAGLPEFVRRVRLGLLGPQ